VKESPVKTEVKDEPALEEDKRPWWVKELIMADEATTVIWSAEDIGVIVDLTKDDDALPPVKQEE
jgi:hypothetical protein